MKANLEVVQIQMEEPVGAIAQIPQSEHVNPPKSAPRALLQVSPSS